MDKMKIPINIYMDLSKAFDTLNHDILLEKLSFYGIQDKAKALLSSYISNRKQYVEFNNTTSNLMIIKTGVPQGSILGLLLFIIYLNDIKNVTKRLHPVTFADDTTLITTLNSFRGYDLEKEINYELEQINNWFRLNKLSLNCEKTKAMIFHTPQRKIRQPNIMINNTKIEYVREYNLLGIILQQNLKWRLHVDMVAKKISKTVGLLCKLKQILPKTALYHIYNTLIMSHLNYGLLIWGHQSGRLQKLQKKAIRCVQKEHFYAHSSPLFKKLNSLKLDDLCKLHEFAFIYKLENKCLPDYFLKLKENLQTDGTKHRYHTRNYSKYKAPIIKHEFARQLLIYKIPKIYVNMQEWMKQMIQTHGFISFKMYIKKSLISKYSDVCDIKDCFSCNYTK
jgi:hypothetical protein